MAPQTGRKTISIASIAVSSLLSFAFETSRDRSRRAVDVVTEQTGGNGEHNVTRSSACRGRTRALLYSPASVTPSVLPRALEETNGRGSKLLLLLVCPK